MEKAKKIRFGWNTVASNRGASYGRRDVTAFTMGHTGDVKAWGIVVEARRKRALTSSCFALFGFWRRERGDDPLGATGHLFFTKSSGFSGK